MSTDVIEPLIAAAFQDAVSDSIVVAVNFHLLQRYIQPIPNRTSPITLIIVAPFSFRENHLPPSHPLLMFPPQPLTLLLTL